MNRRDFLRRMGLGAAAVGLSPYLDLLPIEPAPSAACVGEYEAVYHLMMQMICDNPASCARIDGIY